ncbi:hypothetical protein DTO166G4_5793 [Paecilomyces variotii]|uniref:Ferric oxidoreductase domain-containing protein n=1 Tax=Byssochlamys spectabilis TaxID=264951 RepID=A0A443HQ49_BYSSP|nr:hypothetical protein C8Q69DRAFT_311147 [Paecilomyces variotii]KAJ9212574.1 hypothetical protein DTO166G4_5793 [Paecilomyces variotii]KAJ9221245.1 hypothetical protein DTO169C6_6381 [Paecilomyces variotii]KAJ9230124.1 hypothetical protein DTO166G5_7502 [Paecilomyces variotii]KAJ9254341.1 hypothetical protein DTO195F2_6706 [Paecilomyces variotii]KAJ9304874.1 hypothetical protein DTO217A2_5683 [Paecilomyces variotii]
MPLSWPYHFVSLSPAEVQQRRDVLTIRGHYAQYSTLAMALFISLYARLSKKRSVRPEPKKRGISWWNSPPVQGWKETRKQYLLILSWLALLLTLSVWKTGNDYLHLTKSLGHVALSQLPFQTLLSPVSFMFTSNPGLPSILSIVTSIPQPALSPYHRLFGRLIILPLLFAHAVLYLSFFAQSGHPDFGTLLVKRVRDSDVQYGIAGLVLAVCILFVRRPMAQRPGATRVVSKRRRTFYVVHLLSVAGLLAAAYFHVVYARTFVLESLGAFVISVGCCWAMDAGKSAGKRGSSAKHLG